MASPQVFALKCPVQRYAWGKKGQDSAVAQLKASADPEFKVNEDSTYAELWMGTHPNGPSIVSIPGQPEQSLSTWVEQNQARLGADVNTVFKGNLPFLFKVLSVRTALSIQAHPNKAHAEQLHKTHPDIYKDPNHKPEMAIALTPFVGLCGFRPITEVAHYLKEIKEFTEAVGEESAKKLIAASLTTDTQQHREAMRECFVGLMQRDKAMVTNALKALVSRVQTLKNSSENISALEGDLLLTLDRDFPGDAGGFAIYFLNIVCLEPGEAMFLEANLPHAYLSGDCMECMACSDNVVRAGLTPKYIDVPTLCGMLDYTCRSVARAKFLGIESHGNINITIFKPPVPDFGVSKFDVPAGQDHFDLQSFESASICIVVKGQGEASHSSLTQPLPLKPGSVFFVSADVDVDVKTDGNRMLLFRAYAGVV